MNEKVREAVENYQCTGCVNTPFKCYDQSNFGKSCDRHVIGTRKPNIGKILLGMPKGFTHVGQNNIEIEIFSSFEEFSKTWKYDFLNFPVWKYLGQDGNTLVKGTKPRVNINFIHIFIGNCMDKIECQELTQDFLDSID